MHLYRTADSGAVVGAVVPSAATVGPASELVACSCLPSMPRSLMSPFATTTAAAFAAAAAAATLLPLMRKGFLLSPLDAQFRWLAWPAMSYPSCMG